HQRAVFGLEQDRVPAGMALAIGLDTIGDLDGGGPLSILQMRDPDSDVFLAFIGSAEPGGDKSAPGFDDRGGVTAWEGSGFVDELGLEDSIGREGRRGSEEEQKCERANHGGSEIRRNHDGTTTRRLSVSKRGL